MTKGLYVSFLGIDGIGKTTLAKRFQEELRSKGVPVREVSWRKSNESGGETWPTDALQELWLDTFRLLFGGAQIDGHPLQLPRTYSEWSGENWEDRLGELPISSAHRSGPLAAALVELAGNLIFTDAVIRPLVDDGFVVVQETFPYKHVLKELLVAKQVSRDIAFLAVVEQMEQLTANVFGSRHMQPDLGVFVEGAAELAHGWRLKETGKLGLLEDFGAAGNRGRDSYLELQQQSASYFSEVTHAWDWSRHQVDGEGLESNMARGLDVLLGHSSVAPLISTPSS